METMLERSLRSLQQDNISADACASAADFPAWFYAEITCNQDLRVVSIFHVSTPSGVIPYWYEDPENQHRGLPLLQAMQPSLLGDYGSVLQSSHNLKLFVALCRNLDDLPDPLVAVQVITRINRNNDPDVIAKTDLVTLRMLIRQALAEILEGNRRRRLQFETVMRVLTGV